MYLMIKHAKKACTTLLSMVMLSISLLAITAPVQAAIIKTDIVMLVDETGSMGTIHENLRNSVGQFASILAEGGLDARFALVGFGRAGDTLRLLTPLVEVADFVAAAMNLYSQGRDERIYDATAFALEAYMDEKEELDYRDDAVKNLILFSDGSSNGNDEYMTADSVDTLLKANNALFNAVLGGNYSELQELANDNGGQVFNLDRLDTSDETQITEFTVEFAETKLQETLDFCQENPDNPACSDSEPVPAPTGIYLFLLGLLVASRRLIS